MYFQKLAYYLKHSIFVIVTALLAVIIGTLLIYRSINRMPEQRMIFFFYETNVSGGSAENWAAQIKAKHPELKYTEAQGYTKAAGLTLTNSTTGWDIIQTRLANNEGDILFLPLELYEFLLNYKDIKGNRALLPINKENYSSEILTDRGMETDGQLYGIRADGLMLEGLDLTLTNGENNLLQGINGNKEIIACIYRKTVNPQLTEEVLADILNQSKVGESNAVSRDTET